MTGNAPRGEKEEKETEIAKRKETKEENEVEFPSFFCLDGNGPRTWFPVGFFESLFVVLGTSAFPNSKCL